MGWTYCVIWFLCWSVSECWQLFNSQPVIHGEVQSPQYPRPYPPNLLKQWDLWVPGGYQIQLSVTHLDIKASLGCYQDSLTVLHDQKVLGKFCGQENSNDHPGKEPILSQDNSLTLIFQTNDSTAELQQHIGFAAIYKAVDVDECSKQDPGSGPLCSQICINTPGSYHCSCHYGYKLHLDQHACLLSCDSCIFDQHEGRLSSPGYPDPSPPFLSCKYIISVEPRFTVTLNFTDNFHIESVNTQQGPRCLHHWLQVTIPDREPMKLCGGKSPGLIATNSSTVRLDYHTDNEGLSHGWSLHYNTDEVKCPFPGNVAKGRMTPVLTEYFFRDYIYVTCKRGYRLMMDGREIKKFSAMCQRDGQWQLPLPQCQVMDCGEPEPLLNGGVTFQNQYRSVVQYHCNEPFYSLPGGVNVSFTCEADGKWRSKHNVTPTCIPVCGKPTKLISAYQRIIGGREAPDNTIPWQVLLSVDGLRAGAMVIADRWLMTAAHVLTQGREPLSPEAVRIYMGHTHVKALQNSPLFAASVHVHPGYNNPSGLDFDNNIALIKLQEPITFNSSIMPICLPAEGATYITGMMGLVSGFGVTEIDKRRILTNKLKYVQLPVVDQETCTDSITVARKTKDSVPSLTNNMFCAGVPEGGKDSCQDKQTLEVKFHYRILEATACATLVHLYSKLTADMGWTYCVISFLCWSVSECWQLFNSQPAICGEVQSPQYPRPYPPNLLKQWDLRVPEGYQIQLSVTHLDIKASLGCYQDSLTVLHDQKFLGKFCGQENSNDHPGKEPILSQGNSLTLIFQTNDSTAELQQHIGFAAIYKAVDVDECSKQDPGSGPLCSQICINTPGSYHCSCYYGYKLHLDQHTCLSSCGGCIFDKHEGRLSSPGYPDPSPPFLSCKYIISVEPRFTVTLNFTDNFHIESVDTQQGPRCLHHWLQVTIPDREPMKLCGGKSPGLIATNSSTVRLDYHTDNEGLSHGWSLDYSTKGEGRRERLLLHSPILSSIKKNHQNQTHFVRHKPNMIMSLFCFSPAMDCGEPKPLLNGGMTFLSGLKNQYRSVVQYHCNEPFYSFSKGTNVRFTCEADGKWRSNHTDVTPTCIPVCGKPTKLISTYQRTVGSIEGPDNTIPWHVLLSVDGQRAGGMVIADRWIMTAAHVLTYNGNPVLKEDVRIYMGFFDVKTLLGSPVLAASIHIHPEYNNPSGLDFNNDIALIKLQEPITFNSSIMPICLPAEGATYTTGKIGLVSGFGLTEAGKRRILANKMKYVHLLVVEQETCSSSVDTLKKRRDNDNLPSLTNNMFCAGVPGGGQDSCHGDSGSPLALRDDGRFWAAGIVSWGVDCGQPGTYGIYTRVTNYLDWINKTMKEN
ncbi:ovochymase-2-like [Chaetodon auriga]|uniref:ovochymase-2-like n=1 Tax=Chaetodon auriga TaxID=39042 RepID=UPI0040328C90